MTQIIFFIIGVAAIAIVLVSAAIAIAAYGVYKIGVFFKNHIPWG